MCRRLSFASYQYYYSDTFSGSLNSNWGSNQYYTTGSNGLTSTASANGVNYPLIYIGQGPSNGRYEIKSTLPSPSAYPSGYIQYAAASTTTGGATDQSWSFYSVEFTPSTNSSSSTCTATVNVFRQDIVNGSPQQTYMGGTSGVACPDNTTVRTVFQGTPGSAASLIIYVNDQQLMRLFDSQPLSGQPGVAIDLNASGSNGYISRVDLGPWDSIQPNPVDPASIGTTVYTNRVDIQWQPATDDANGIGVYGYALLRDGNALTWFQPGTSYSDLAVIPGTSYTYSVEAIDYHENVSTPTSFHVTTQEIHVSVTIATPPSRTGVRPTGAYWGAAGEQMDMASGNLNWTLPLLRAKMRGGTSVGISLNYNSQMWRQDTGGTWNLGADVGYGFGWRLMAGSVEAYWSDPYTIDHYIFTDSTGAEYALGVNTNGIWTSNEGIYVSYEPDTNKLSFPDGSFWLMTCESGGNEADLGTRYPKVMQDPNGNQLS